MPIGSLKRSYEIQHYSRCHSTFFFPHPPVFNSLLRCHCINDDQEAVDNTLQVMSGSGLEPGTDTFAEMAVAYALAKNWEKVEKVMDEAAQKVTRIHVNPLAPRAQK